MEITVNGKPRIVADGITVAGLLDFLEIRPERVAVECNTDIVDKERFAEVTLQGGDTVEIIQFVGGG